MDINRKIQILLIAVTIFISSFSVYAGARKNTDPETGEQSQAEIVREVEEKKRRDELKSQMEGKADVEAQCAVYIAFCDSILDVTDEVKLKKDELRNEVEAARSYAGEFSEDIEHEFNSAAIDYETIKENLESKYALITNSLAKCEQIKVEIDGLIAKYNAEQDAIKKERERKRAEQNKNKSEASSSGSASGKNSSKSSSSSSGGSSSSRSSSSSGGYSGGGSVSYSDNGSSRSGSSSSGGSSSSTGGSVSYSDSGSSHSGSSSSESSSSSSDSSSSDSSDFDLGSER